MRAEGLGRPGSYNSPGQPRSVAESLIKSESPAGFITRTLQVLPKSVNKWRRRVESFFFLNMESNRSFH